MKMKDNERSFKLDNLSIFVLNRDVEISEDFPLGRYIGKTPGQAAKKAFTQICRRLKLKFECEVLFNIIETTRDSQNSIYSYKGERKKDSKILEKRISVCSKCISKDIELIEKDAKKCSTCNSEQKPFYENKREYLIEFKNVTHSYKPCSGMDPRKIFKSSKE